MAKRNNDILGDIEQVQASVPVPEAQEATPERRELQEWVRTTEKYAQCLKELKAVRQAIDEEIAEIRTVLAREQQLSEELKKGTPDFQAFSDLVKKNNSKYGEVFRQELWKVAAAETNKIAGKLQQEMSDVVQMVKNEVEVYVTNSKKRTEEVRRNNDVFTISWKRWVQLEVFYISNMMLASFLFHEVFLKYDGLEILLILNFVALLWDFFAVLLRYVVGWRRRK